MSAIALTLGSGVRPDDESVIQPSEAKSARTDLPDGQISRRFPVQPCLKKYFA
jgi:hypothetical protein